MAANLVFITGATGHIGFRVLVDTLKAGYTVRASVRRDAQGATLKSHSEIQPYAASLETVVVPDITVDGAFDAVLDGVVYVLHIASPLPKGTDNFEKNIIEPAIRGTTSILHSALKVKTIRRVVITSSLLALISAKVATEGDDKNTYSAQSRVQPLPTGPWNHPFVAYIDSKILALDATDRFIADQSPAFSIVNIQPGWVIGANALVTDAKAIADGSNAVVMTVLLGQKYPGAAPGNMVGLSDVSRIHVAALDESKVVGNKSYALDGQRPSFNEAAEIVRRALPAETEDGRIPLGGDTPAASVKFDVEETIRNFGPLAAYEQDVIGLAKKYLELTS